MNRIREELDRLTELIAAWDDLRDVPVLERDLALAKLRDLYETLRFADNVPVAVSSVQEPAREEEATAVNIDLDDVLSLGLIPDADQTPELETATVAVEPAAEPTSVVVAEPAQESDTEFGQIAEDEDPFFESNTEAEFERATELESAPELIPEPVVESEPEESAPEQEPVSEVLPAPEPVSARPEPAPQPILASLFGLEEEEEPAHHRRKQRVIMSLYGNESPAHSGNTAPDDIFEEIDLSEPVRPSSLPKQPEAPQIETLSDPAGDIAPDDESYGGEEPSPEEFEELDDPSPEAPVDPVPAPAEKAAPAVLGDVLNHERKTLADTFAAHPATARSSVDLRASLGLNDRFLLIRDLFEGDAVACDAALDELNSFDNLDDCMIHIAENYSWNPDCDGAKFLIDLLERKYA